MELFVRDLPPDTQLLIAMGAAVAAGCQPCLKRLVDLARDEALDVVQMRAAVNIGQLVKDQPAREMKVLADNLLGVDAAQVACACGDAQTVNAGCCG